MALQSSAEKDTAREQLLPRNEGGVGGDQKVGNDGGIGQEYMDEEETEQSKLTAALAKFTKLVVPFFVLILLFAIIALALGLVDAKLKGTLVWEVLGTGAAGGLFGAWGVYKWGTIQDEIDRLKGENQKYEGEIGELKQTKTQLTTHVSEMQSSVHQLQGSVGDLNHQLTAFDDLRQELEKVSGDNQDIATLLDNTTKVFRDMRTVALANEKASLVSLYYDVAFKDGEAGMSAKEYERFKGRLPRKQREKFEAMGSFKELAGDNAIIDLSEFEVILEKFLAIIEYELLQAGFENA